MQEYKPTHKQLVKRVASCFKNMHRSSVVVTEFATAAPETPDVLVWQSGAWSTLVECKVSRQDFVRDKSKFFRTHEDRGVGDSRFYAAPAGLIKPDELPDGWGLLEVDAKGINKVVDSEKKEADKRRECMMLMSVLRRLEISTAVFVRQNETPNTPEEKL